MDKKTCFTCNETKYVDQFNKKSSRKDGLNYECKTCSRIRAKELYQTTDHKDKIRANIVKYRDRNFKYLYEYLSENPCVDCGETDILVLEFDHLPGTDKVGGVATMARIPVTLDKLKQEIQKCVVRCRNDHVRATYRRLGYTWHQKYMAVGG